MKIKVNKHKLNIHYRGSPWGSRTQQHAYCLRYAHSHHIESHLGKKQPQVKFAIAFLFGQLHVNNVTSHALFYGGHLVMRSKRCAVQNQRITFRISTGRRRTSWLFYGCGRGFELTGLPRTNQEANQLAILQVWPRIWTDRNTENGNKWFRSVVSSPSTSSPRKKSSSLIFPRTNPASGEVRENMQYSNMDPYLFCDVINVRTGLTSKSIKWRPWAFLHC